MIPLLLAAALCVPPGMPPLETLHATRGRVHDIEGTRSTEHYGVVAMVYADDAGHAWNVFRMLGAVAFVDDHMEDDENTAWWVDGGLVTDEIPPRVQPDPKPTCLWHRRGDRT